MGLSVSQERLLLSAPFVISGYTFVDMDVVVARITQNGLCSEGEAAGVHYLGDDAAHMTAEIECVRAEIEDGADREALRSLLPPGGARNALDCALWDLEARRAGRPVWQLAGLTAPHPLTTTFTVVAGDPRAMAEQAVAYAQARSVKLKLTGDSALDAERVRCVREARPEVWLGVDANQGFTPDSLEALMPALVACDVKLIEQPFARGRESDLEEFDSAIPIAADESAQGLVDVEGLVGRFDIVNIKLDKCGGLTEALLMAAEARRHGLGVMVGNMVGTSLAMAPAFLLGQVCDIADLDGTLFITKDRSPSMTFEDGCVSYPDNGWGRAR